MASVISMPRLSDTMSDGVLVKWHKKEGDKVEPGQVLGDVETDKAVQECEAFESGTILKILAPEGTRVPVGEPIAILGEAGEEIGAILATLSSLGGAASAPPASGHGTPPGAGTQPGAPAAAALPAGAARSSASAASAAAPPAPAALPAAPPPAPGARVLASPVARKIAREADLDLARVHGSGPSGRIVRKDVEAALLAPKPAPVVAAAPALAPAAAHTPSAWAANGESKPASSMRRTIARRLVESTTTVPHFYLTLEVDMDEAVKFRTLVHDPEGRTADHVQRPDHQGGSDRAKANPGGARGLGGRDDPLL